MKKEFLELQKSYEKLIKKKERGVIQNYKNSYKRLRKKLERIYDKYEKDGQLDFDDLRRHKELRRLDFITANIMISLYKDNDKLIKSTLKQIYDKTVEVSTSNSIVPVKKEIDPTKVIEREVGGRIWTERTAHYGNNFVYDVHSIIKEGLSRGDTYTTMAKNIEKRFGKDIGNTVRIARTEGARVLEDTKFQTFEEINKSPNIKVVKVWHTMSDERVRDTHSAMEGVEVDFDEEFILPSGATCMYPKASGVASEDINCRCYCEYKTVVKDEDLGYNDYTEVEEVITENQEKYTKEEIDEALDSYVSGDGMWVNNNLRGVGEAAEYPLSEDDKIYIEKLDQATKANIVKEKTLYRSTDISSVLGDMSDLDYDNLKSAYLYNDKSKPAQEALGKYLKNIEGKEIVDKGFMSTTKSKDIALDFQDFTGSSKPCVIEFNIPKGIKGIDLKDFDIADMEQKEVLLARNQKFIIKEVRQEQGQFYFKADLVAEKGYNKNTIEFDLQLFSNKDKEIQTDAQLKKGINSDKKNIEKHKNKINNPQKYYEDWKDVSEDIKNGRIKHWEKEISNFKKNIQDAEEELKKRGGKI